MTVAALYETLLFFHVLAAFMLVATVIIFTAIGLGAAAAPRVLSVANVLWAIGGLGTLVLGIWLAIYLQAYHVWDGWVIAAIILWALATETGRRAEMGFRDAASSSPDGALAPPQRVRRTSGARPEAEAMLMHWLRTALILALLVVMIYKPGA
jgi:hypothetical protein